MGTFSEPMAVMHLWILMNSVEFAKDLGKIEAFLFFPVFEVVIP